MCSWELYRKGEGLEAGVEVLRLLQQTPAQERTIYRVRRLCCGAESSMTHSTLARRAQARQKYCLSCSSRMRPARRKTSAGAVAAREDPPPYGVRMPDWPAPQVELPERWVPWAGKVPGAPFFRKIEEC